MPRTALASSKTAKPTPPPDQSESQKGEKEVQYSLADPFVGINPPPETPPEQPGGGRMASRADPSQRNYPPEEMKRRSSSRPHGVMEPKHRRSSDAEPSWDVSQIGHQQADKAQTQPPSEPEPPEPAPRVKSVIRSVRLALPKPEDLKGLGPATWSRYNGGAKEDRQQREPSRHHDASVRLKESHHKSRSKSLSRSDHKSGKQDRKSGHGSGQKLKDESMGAKLLARKEKEKWYRKIVENPMLYLVERQHQILPEEHRKEIDARSL